MSTESKIALATTIVLALTGFGVQAGTGFKITRWVILFWALALFVGVYSVTLVAWPNLIRGVFTRKRRLARVKDRIKHLNATVSEVVLPFTNHHQTISNVVAQIKFTRGRDEIHVVDYGAWDLKSKKQRVDFCQGDTVELTALRIDRNEKPVRLYTVHRQETPPDKHSWMLGGVRSYSDYLLPLFTGKPEWMKAKIKIIVTLVGSNYRQVFKYTLIQSVDDEFTIEV